MSKLPPYFTRCAAAILLAAVSLSCQEESAEPKPPAPVEPEKEVQITPPEQAGSQIPSGSGDQAENEIVVMPDGTLKRKLNPEEQQQVMSQLFQARAQQQANGLGSGSLTVNGAWHYTGYSYLSPNPASAIEARLVAVDITLSGHTPHFDLDDIEIVDAKSYVSFGSDPHVEYLTLEGKLMAPGQSPTPPPRASRYLLIYAFPKDLNDFRLFYWGRQLTAAPVEFATNGWELPYPEKVTEEE